MHLASVIQHVFEIHLFFSIPVICSSYCQINSIVWINHNLFIHSPIHGHLDYFEISTIIINTTINICVQIFLWTYIILSNGLVCKSWIDQSCDDYIFHYYLIIYFEVIVDSHTSVRNNTEIFHAYFSQLLPIVTTVQYYNQEVEMDIIHQFYSDFAIFICRGECVPVCSFM